MLGSSLNTWNSVGFIHFDVWSVHKERDMKMGFLHIVVVVVGELVLDPFEAVPQGWFELTFHGVHVVGCHPLSPLHLWIIGCCKLVHLAYWTIKAVWVGAYLKPMPGVWVGVWMVRKGSALLHDQKLDELWRPASPLYIGRWVLLEFRGKEPSKCDVHGCWDDFGWWEKIRISVYVQ